MKKYCNMCCNARVEPELYDNNDLSYYGIGKTAEGHSMFLGSGDGKPVRIEVMCKKSESHSRVVAIYYPKYCPNCGRKLDEYEVKNETNNSNAR